MFFLFPGQGSQQPGMAEDFYRSSPAARKPLDIAEATLGEGFLDRLFKGGEKELRDTRMAQVALVSSSIAIAQYLKSSGVVPTGCAGHSVGEIAALVIAGSLDYKEALLLTQERGRLMAEEAPEGGMIAVLGLRADAIEDCLPEGAEIANFNGPAQTIVSGSVEALAETTVRLKQQGAKRMLPLKVSGPFHSSYMKPAAEHFRATVEDLDIKAPSIRFVSSVSGADESDPERIRELLWKQIEAPVRWTAVMQTLGRARAIEVGPGGVLQGLAKRMDGGPAVGPAGTFEQARTFTIR